LSVAAFSGSFSAADSFSGLEALPKVPKEPNAFSGSFLDAELPKPLVAPLPKANPAEGAASVVLFPELAEASPNENPDDLGEVAAAAELPKANPAVGAPSAAALSAPPAELSPNEKVDFGGWSAPADLAADPLPNAKPVEELPFESPAGFARKSKAPPAGLAAAPPKPPNPAKTLFPSPSCEVTPLRLAFLITLLFNSSLLA